MVEGSVGPLGVRARAVESWVSKADCGLRRDHAAIDDHFLNRLWQIFTGS